MPLWSQPHFQKIYRPIPRSRGHKEAKARFAYFCAESWSNGGLFIAIVALLAAVWKVRVNSDLSDMSIEVHKKEAVAMTEAELKLAKESASLRGNERRIHRRLLQSLQHNGENISKLSSLQLRARSSRQNRWKKRRI